jgi:RNA polymerase sigma-70 factor (ECF subfamily)
MEAIQVSSFTIVAKIDARFCEVPRPRRATRGPMANVDRSTLGEMESLLREHGPFLRRLARGLVRDEHVAEDLVHDTWLAALRRPGGSLRDARGWLGAVLRRRVASHRRHAQLRPRAEAYDRAGATPSDEHRSAHTEAEAIALRLERERLLHDAVTRLTEPYRTTIVLRYHEELTPTAIALRTGAPVKTVKTRLARGLEQLRLDLARRGVEGEAGEDPARAWLSVVAPLLQLERLASPATLPSLSVWLPITVMKKSLLGLMLLLVGGLVLWRTVAQDGVVSPLAMQPESPALAATLAELTVAAAKIDAPAAQRPTREAASSVSAATGAIEHGGLARLEVHITDDAGRPLAGRNVIIQGPRRSGGRDDARLASTAEGGIARFTGLVPGQYSALDALGVMEDHRVYLTAGATEVLEWTIRDDVLVRARVEHVDGQPAKLAELWGVGHSFGGPLVWRCGSTDGAGRLEFRAGRALLVQASLASHVPSELLEVAGAPEVEPGVREMRLVLGARGAPLSGRVVDGAGVPIAGARVVAGPRGGWVTGDMRGVAPEPPVVETELDGTFTYAAALPPGRHEVAAFAEDFAATTIHVEVPERGPVAPLEVELVLDPGGRIVGRVTRPDGTPARKAELTLGAPEPVPFQGELAPGVSAVTADDGTYELRLVPRGDYVVSVESHYKEPLAYGEARLVVERDTLVLDLVLSEGSVIAGRVVDRGGVPVAGVQIRMETPDSLTYPRGISTDAAGRFRATCLPKPQPGMEGVRFRGHDGDVRIAGSWTIEAWSLSEASREVHGSVEGVAPGTEDVEIVIDRPTRASAFIVGRIVAATGHVPEDVVVTMWREGLNAGHFVELGRGTGTFRQGPLFPGRYRLELTREREVVATRSGIEVAADETVDIGVLHLDGGGRLEVALTLVGAELLPAGGEAALLGQASVTLSRDGQRQQSLERTESGWRSNNALEAGTWRLAGSGEALVFTPRDVEVLEGQVTRVDWSAALARAADLRVSLPAAYTWSRVRVRATDASGALVLETPFVERAELTPDAFESFEVNLPAGTLQVVVETDTDVGLTESVVVPQFPTPFRKVELRVP